MARRAVFDPTDKDLFNEQRQRFDWTLLQNGTVFQYDIAFHFESVCQRLAGLGYLVHRIDGHGWISIDDMYDAFARAMSYAPDYGRGPDAFEDSLSNVASFTFGSDPSTTGTVLAIAGFDTVVQLDPRIAQVTLDGFARQARLAGLYGHPMLCLVESTATNLGPVGCLQVHQGSTWEDPPPVAWPIRESEIVEYQFETTDRDAEKLIDVLRAALPKLLGDWARWQVVPPAPLTVGDTIDQNAEGSLERCNVVVAFGVRGDGDISGVEDALHRDLRNAGVRVGAYWAASYPGGADQDLVLTKYGELRGS
jgi:hypothetical protein